MEGVIVIGQDLTVIKELEKRIIHAEKLASIGQLAASVVHEINNPMTAVAAYSEALLMKARCARTHRPRTWTSCGRSRRAATASCASPGTSCRYARPGQGQARAGAAQRRPGPGGGLLRARRDPGPGQRAAASTPPSCRPSPRCAPTWCRCSSTSSPTPATPCPPGGQVTLVSRAARGRTRWLEVCDTGTGIEPEAPGAHLRSLLHHQGGGQGHRPGALHRPGHRREPRRPHHRGQHAGQGHHLHPAPAAGPGSR